MAKIGTKQNTKIHAEIMELEHIISVLGDAMRHAHFPYVAESGRLTPGIEMALERYRWHTMKVTGIRTQPCHKCGQPVRICEKTQNAGD